MQNKKRGAKWFKWLFIWCLRVQGGGGKGWLGWSGVGWAWEMACYFHPCFIPLFLCISPCPLGKRADYFCWETDYIHLANTLLFLMTKYLLDFSLILALRPAGWYEIHRPLHAQGRERPRLRSVSYQVGLLLPLWVRPTHANLLPKTCVFSNPLVFLNLMPCLWNTWK